MICANSTLKNKWWPYLLCSTKFFLRPVPLRYDKRSNSIESGVTPAAPPVQSDCGTLSLKVALRRPRPRRSDSEPVEVRQRRHGVATVDEQAELVSRTDSVYGSCRALHVVHLALAVSPGRPFRSHPHKTPQFKNLPPAFGRWMLAAKSFIRPARQGRRRSIPISATSRY